MGDLRPDNPPPDEPHGLPDLPAEWGTIVIPDDASELAAEADAIRRELRADARRARIRGVFGLRRQPASLGIPIVIMTVAIITTLASLLVVTWGTQPPPPAPTTTAATGPAPNTSALGDLRLPKANGDMVLVRDIAPLIMLLTDGCDCGQLISDVAAHAPKGVTVVPVTGSPVHSSQNDPANVVRLVDTKGVLRSRYGPDTPDGEASALVVNGQGELINNLQHVTRYADIAPMELK